MLCVSDEVFPTTSLSLLPCCAYTFPDIVSTAAVGKVTDGVDTVVAVEKQGSQSGKTMSDVTIVDSGVLA